ncbi:MAG: hypothetical protein GC136_01305 [Alphaproteobacteria bacterium]|nr:hypothetical protein [Alphaproteobacteria bacterium]
MFDWLKKLASPAAPPAEPTPEERRRKLIDEALVNAKAAREAIGEDTLARIAAIMAQKNNSALNKAKQQIAEIKGERIADEMKSLIHDEKA